MHETNVNCKLNGKKILLFVPFFFNYENIIAQQMKSLGSEVVLYNERSVVSAFDRALLKVFPNLFNIKTKRYYNSIIRRHKDEKFDYILFVRCDMPTVKTLKNLKSSFPHAKMCLYLWDSIKNTPKILKKIDLFDYVSSFDREDCKNNETLHFRPLFYYDVDSSNCRKSYSELDYDISFCGTIHSDRYKILLEIIKQCKEKEINYFGFHYLQSNFIYRFYRLTKRSFRKTKKNDFSFTKKTSNEINDIENNSKVILDIQHPNQSGLTMRTIETLGRKKKLITTNTDIINYDFYNENNVCIIDRNKPEIRKEFFETPFKDIPEEVYRKYTIEFWIYDVLGINIEEDD